MPTINLATLRVKLTADNAEYQEKVTESKQKTQDHAKVFETAIAGAAVAAFAVAAKAAIDFARESSREFQQFDKQIREVYTLMPGMSNKAMDAMSGDVLAFSAEVGRVSDEVVPALYQAISAGVPQDNVFEFMRVASNAAQGGVTELETAVDGISSVMNAYGQDVISATQASDLMFTAVKGGKLTFDELSRSLFNVIPTAASLNLEFGNVTAALATMTAQGTPTTVATTQLRQLLIELSKDGSAAAATFEKLSGKSFTEFIAQGGNLAGALAIMEQGAADSNLRLSDMFSSVEAGNAALALTGAGAAKFAQELEAAANASGATEEAAAIMNDSLEHQEALAKAAKEEMMVLIGEGLEPAKRAWLELQTAIAKTAVESLKTGAVEDDLRAQFEELGFAGADLEMRIVAARMATTELGNEQIGAEAQAVRMARAVELLSGEFDGNVDALNDQVSATIDAEESMANATETATAYYIGMGELAEATNDQADANRKAEASVSALARSEQLHAIDIAREADQYRASQRAMEEAAAARELFIAQFDAYTAVINEARTPVEELITAQADLTIAQGEWVTAVVDTSGQVAEINQQLSFDLADGQRKAYQDILVTVEEGSAEWLTAYDALQSDLTASQRAALVAQAADLQAQNGAIQSVYTGNAAAAEEAQTRIDAANAAISLSYRQAALDIAMVKISEQYGADALAAQEAYLNLSVAMGTLTQEEADRLLDVATKTDAVTTATTAMMDKYLEDGQLTADEAEKIATAVDLIEESSGLSYEAIQVLVDGGVTDLAQLSDSAQTTGTDFANSRAEVDDLNTSLLGLPTEITVDVYVNTHGDVPPTGGGAPSGGGAGTPGRGGDNEYAAGGFTGFGATADIAGIVHRGEYVFNADAVASMGVDTLDAMHSIAQMGGTPAVGVPAGGGDTTNTYNIYNQTREAAALTMAQVYQEKRARLDAWMGI